MRIRFVIGLFSCSAVYAQTSADIPLKNWPAALYWQPSAVETQTRLRAELRSPTPEAAMPAGSLVFVAMTPCRVIDTRASQMFPGPFGTPSLSPATVRSFPLQSSTLCSIPPSAMAYSLNVTLVPPGPVGYLTLWPTGAPQPNAVTLDDIPGDIRNNAAIVPAGTPSGSISAVVNATTDVVIDINGYYAPSTGITLAQGTASAPSLSFSGDAGTGIFSTATGYLNLTTGGVNRVTVRSDGDLDLAGSMRKGGFLFLHTLGSNNTGAGILALSSNTSGTDNTGVGLQALRVNTSGAHNTAIGSAALTANTTGAGNTATGSGALEANTGSYNTSDGAFALSNNTSGYSNTATGYSALASNGVGNNNTATGYNALYSNNGNYNTAHGTGALFGNSMGGFNTATGAGALESNYSGSYNTANGTSALFNNSTGSYNTASGVNALSSTVSGGNNTAFGGSALMNATGGSNTALGFNAGIDITTGSNNVDIVSRGTSSDNGIIRIGSSPGHVAFFAAAIRGVTPANGDGVPVYIDSAGQLGTASSSLRFKEDIEDMGEASNGLIHLRPVRFRYKQPYADGTKPVDYGLIAEEVANIYPDLVAKSVDGQIETVQYQKLIPMLLNELQKLRTEVEALKKR